MSLKVQNPASFLLARASGVGKTYWIFRFINHKDEIFTEKIEKVLYFYEIWQSIFEKYVDQAEFIQGPSSVEHLKSADRKLVILDDLMNSNKELITKIFTVYSYHYDFTVMFTAQNLFNKSLRQTSLNTKFVVLFKNCRDLNQIQYFLRQAFPKKYSVMEAYINETQAARGYILLDFRCDTDQNTEFECRFFLTS